MNKEQIRNEVRDIISVIAPDEDLSALTNDLGELMLQKN